MSKPTNDATYLWDRLSLTQEVSGVDVPIWKGRFDNDLKYQDELFCCGSNLLVWEKDLENGGFFPSVVSPLDRNNKMEMYKELHVQSPKSMIYLPGRTLDLLIHPSYTEKPEKVISGIPAYFAIFFVQNGSILQQENINLGDITFSHYFSKQNMSFYQDEFLVFINDKTLYMFNIVIGNLEKKIEGVPQNGVLIVENNSAYIWSRLESKKAIVNLENGDISAIGFDPIPADMEIVGFSSQNLVVKNTEAVIFYNAWGCVMMSKPLNSKTYDVFDGMVESYNSRTCAFVLRQVGKGRVFGCRDGYLIESDVGYFSTRSMVLYEDIIYSAKDATTLELFMVNLITKEEVDFSVVGHQVTRYMIISPSYGWVMELTENNMGPENRKIISVRAPFNRPLHLPLPIKKQWPTYTPDHYIVPPFLYHNKNGFTRIWTAEEQSINGAKFLKLRLFDWDSVKENVGNQLAEIGEIDLPKESSFGRWFRTDEWVVLVIQRFAIILGHDGARGLRKLGLSDHHEQHYDFNIKAVRGFSHSLWLIGGQTQKVKEISSGKDCYVDHIKEVVYWDGIRSTSQVWDKGFDMSQATATGIRLAFFLHFLNVRNMHTGPELLAAELIIAPKDIQAPWIRVTSKNGQIGVKEFTRGEIDYKDNLLCETADKNGMVYFSQGRIISVYDPAMNTVGTKADLDYIHASQPDPLIDSEDDRVTSLSVGLRFLWIGRGAGFYCVNLDAVKDQKIVEYRVPIKPIRIYDEKKLRPQFQAPTIIRPYLSHISELDNQAIMENEEFIWISDRPFQLYKRPDLLNIRHISYVTVIDRAKMLVLTSFISDAPDGVKKNIRSVLCQVIL